MGVLKQISVISIASLVGLDSTSESKPTNDAIDIGDINSIIGRLGFRSGMTINSGENSSNGSIYIMGDVMHEFKGDYSFDAIGRTTAYRNENSGSDTWYDLGIGTDITLSENSKIWLSSKCIFGGEFDNSWQLNAGIRYSF